MLPRWHIFLGAIFSLLIWALYPETKLLYIVLIFLASFMIDFDHYMNAVSKTGKLGLKSAFDYHKLLALREKNDARKRIIRKESFHIFHTIEFHILVFLLGLWIEPFLYIFIGMFFHSLLDIIDMSMKKRLHRREFLFINWLARKIF